MLGTLLFIVYPADLAAVAQKHNVTVYAFADDTQMYLYCSRDDTTLAADRLERCIADVGQWMSANRLKLSTDKTELLWVGCCLSQHGPFPVLQLGLDLITSSDYVRLLGVTITSDSDLNLDRHVSICRQRIMFLQATTTSAYSAFAGPGVSSDTCTRVRYIACRLL